YFGSDNPLGRILLIDGQSLEVTGVIDNIPDQSHLKFDVAVPLSFQLNTWKSETGLEGRENKWYWTGAYTYVMLKDAAAATALEQKLRIVVDKYFPERFRKGGGYRLQPLAQIHLRSNLQAELEPGGSMLYIRLFSVVAWVIMIVSAINLINLSYF